MRKIEIELSNAIKNKSYFCKSNMSININNGNIDIYLYSTKIAYVTGNYIYLYSGGWRSSTTKSRLNTILDTFNLPKITQKNFIWYIGEEEFYDGISFKINN